MKRYTFKEVAKFVEENSDCFLVSTEYVGQLVPLEFICGCGEYCKITFKQFKRPLDAPNNRGKRWCNKCGQQRSLIGSKYTMEQVVECVASESNCRLASSEYINCKGKLDFICECGSLFKTTFDSFVNANKRQCNACGQILNNLPSKKTNEVFVKQVYDLVNNEYTPLTEYVQANEHITMRHNICGHEYPITPDKFVNGQRKCPKCSEWKNSYLSREIEDWLINNDVKHKREYSFSDCKYKKKLRFDFAILNENDEVVLIIEADGEQHFKPFRYSGNKKEEQRKFEETKIRDAIKNKYCEHNGIPMLRIAYFEREKCVEMLSGKFDDLKWVYVRNAM